MSDARSANEIARDLAEALNESLALDQLSLAEVTDGGASEFSLVNPPSIGSSTGRTTLSSVRSLMPRSSTAAQGSRDSLVVPGARGSHGWMSQGEYSPLTPQRWGGGLFHLPRGGIGARDITLRAGRGVAARDNLRSSVASSPGSSSSGRAFMGAAKTTNFSVVRIDEESIRQLCLAKIGQSDRFCVSRHVRSKRRRGVKFVPLLNHFYMPAGNLSASTDTYIPIDDVPSKYRDKFNRGTMSCRQWSHLFVDAMHDVSFEEFDDMPRGALEEQEREEENFSYQHEDVMDEDGRIGWRRIAGV